MKYWVSELSWEAMRVLRDKAITFYKSQGLTILEICEIMKDISNEKLGNLDAFLSHSDMLELSKML